MKKPIQYFNIDSLKKDLMFCPQTTKPSVVKELNFNKIFRNNIKKHSNQSEY